MRVRRSSFSRATGTTYVLLLRLRSVHNAPRAQANFVCVTPTNIEQVVTKAEWPTVVTAFNPTSLHFEAVVTAPTAAASGRSARGAVRVSAEGAAAANSGAGGGGRAGAAPDSAHREGHAGGPDGQAPLHAPPPADASRRRPRVVAHIVHRSVSHAFVKKLRGKPVGEALRGLAQSVTLAGAAGARIVELALRVLSQQPAAPGGGGDPPPPPGTLLELDDKALRLLTHRCFSHTTQGSTGARKKVTDYPDAAWQVIVAAWKDALVAGRGTEEALVPGRMCAAVEYAADRYLVNLKTHCVGGVLAHAKRLLPVLHAATTKAEVTRALALFALPSVWADDAHDNDEEEEASCAVEEEEKGGDAAGAGGAPDGDDAAADAEWTTASQKLCDNWQAAGTAPAGARVARAPVCGAGCILGRRSFGNAFLC